MSSGTGRGMTSGAGRGWGIAAAAVATTAAAAALARAVAAERRVVRDRHRALVDDEGFGSGFGIGYDPHLDWEGRGGIFGSSTRSRRYGLDGRRMNTLQDHTIVMHPGPMIRGMEITADVADSDRSVIVEQVTNGVAVRMAVLYLLLGGNQSFEAPRSSAPQEAPAVGAVDSSAMDDTTGAGA